MNDGPPVTPEREGAAMEGQFVEPTIRELANQLQNIEFWLRPDVSVWRYTKDELLEQRTEVLAVLAARKEGVSDV